MRNKGPGEIISKKKPLYARQYKHYLKAQSPKLKQRPKQVLYNTYLYCVLLN